MFNGSTWSNEKFNELKNMYKNVVLKILKNKWYFKHDFLLASDEAKYITGSFLKLMEVNLKVGKMLDKIFIKQKIFIITGAAGLLGHEHAEAISKLTKFKRYWFKN